VIENGQVPPLLDHSPGLPALHHEVAHELVAKIPQSVADDRFPLDRHYDVPRAALGRLGHDDVQPTDHPWMGADLKRAPRVGVLEGDRDEREQFEFGCSERHRLNVARLDR
jgi:hypothetical protein